MKKTIIWLIIIGIIAAIAVYLYVFHFAAKHDDPLDSGNKVEISAEELFRQYSQFEDSANKMYHRNQAISVTGTVQEIELVGNRYTVKFNTNDSNGGAVICEMDTVENDKIREVKPGTALNVVGFSNGFLMDVQLDRGRLAK